VSEEGVYLEGVACWCKHGTMRRKVIVWRNEILALVCVEQWSASVSLTQYILL
jgi:hypothetical protein